MERAQVRREEAGLKPQVEQKLLCRRASAWRHCNTRERQTDRRRKVGRLDRDTGTVKSGKTYRFSKRVRKNEEWGGETAGADAPTVQGNEGRSEGESGMSVNLCYKCHHLS